jgi:hypothetical protein
MKRIVPPALLALASAFFLPATLHAQEQTEVTIQIKKDGKVVKDTTYQFEDDAEAKQAVKMFEMLSGEGPHEIEYNYTMAHSGGDHTKAMVFVSKDGEKTEIKEIHGDSLVWISEGTEGGDPVKVMKYKIQEGDHSGGEHVVVVTSDEGGTFDILIDEELDGDVVKKEKHVKVIVTDDEHGTMHISEEELIENNEEVYIISGDTDEELKAEILKKIEESEGDDVKVIVIKKGEKPEKESEKQEKK